MKVGEYVRTKYGEICKLKKSKYKDLLYETDIEIARCVDRDCNDYGFDSDTIKDVIKSSPNIIDLIEVGDYVNSLKVDEIDEKGIYNYNSYDGWRVNITNCDEDIKSIVTHEQFESIEYRTGE